MVDIHFEYRNAIRITLPINPEELKISIPGNNENQEIIGIGEINIIRTPRLIPITIESFFPEDKNPQEYIDFFRTVQKEKKPVRIICNDFDQLNMEVSIDGFECAMRAGEEGDRYYTLELQEWKDYSPRLITAEKTTEEKAEIKEEPVPRTEVPPEPPQMYTVQSGDSLYKIAKQYTNSGENWRALYDLNKDIIGANPSLIYPGQSYNIPKNWVV